MKSRLTRTLMGLALVALVCIAPVSLGAQQGTENDEAARSYALQNKLQAIDEHRADFVNQFLSDWMSRVDNNTYDLYEELGPIAMKAPAWQVYGASLAGDFTTMVRILTGEEGAGPYINALTEPQARVSPSADNANDLGSATEGLVYVPIAPCRVLDTRLAPSGILVPGAVARTFHLTSTALGVAGGQGGATSCTGLPSYSHYAWAVNVTVVGATSDSYLKIYPNGGTEPNASIINYNSANAIANGVILTGCLGCSGDIKIKAAGSTVHVIIDVQGYFRSAAVSNVAVTRVAGTAVSIANNVNAFVWGGIALRVPR